MMKKIVKSHELLIKKITAWSKARPDIRAAIILGSRARAVAPADEWSDLDIVFTVEDPAFYLTNTDWLQKIGEVKILFLEPLAGTAGKERRVLFECGLDVDFSFLSAAQLEREMKDGGNNGSLMFFRRGYRVLFDKDGIVPLPGELPQEPVLLRLLTPSEFDETVNDFWFHSVWTAKKLRRGELWVALHCCDYYMKNLLLKVIECHAQILHGEYYDTWFGGRFLENWAEPRTVRELNKCFARYSYKDIRRALLATMDLFRRITRDISEKGGYLYPSSADDYATRLVRHLLPE